MNVLLFSMPDSFEHTPSFAMRFPNGALASLAGNVDAHHDVAVADLVLVQHAVPQTVRELVIAKAPDIVGLSVMTFQRKTAYKVIALVRALRPEAWIVVGGYDPSLAPEAYEDPSLGVDFIVRGEGDLTFRELLRAIDGYEGTFVGKCAMQLAPLVFVRPGELRKAEWTEVNLDAAEWRIPAERMKMREQHIVPLSSQAVSVLRELYALTGKGRYVFPGARTNGRPMSENTVNAGLRRLGYTNADMTGHGFRSMASTLLNEQGWHRDAIERQLAHAERDSVRAAYNYAEHLAERKKMMQAWANYLDSLRAGTEAVPLRTRQVVASA